MQMNWTLGRDVSVRLAAGPSCSKNISTMRHEICPIKDPTHFSLYSFRREELCVCDGKMATAKMLECQPDK